MDEYYTVFIGKANSFILRLFSGYKPADFLADITRMTIKVDDILVDSDVTPEAINWTDTDLDVGEIRIMMGTTVTTPMDYTGAFLTVYDPGTPEGITWANSCDDPSFYVRFCAELMDGDA